MSVLNLLPSWVNTFFRTFWMHPDALFRKGLWLAVYPLQNSVDEGVVRKPHALQVWSEPSGLVEINWGQVGTVRRLSEGSISISGGFPLLVWAYGCLHCLEEGYSLSTCFQLGSDLFLHVCCQEICVISCIDCSGIWKSTCITPLPVPEERCHHFSCGTALPRSHRFGRTGMPPLAWWPLGFGYVVHPIFIGGHYRLQKCCTFVFKLL